MREYVIYWIKDEFSVHYFHKTNVLFQFFQEWRQHRGSSIYEQQFQEITKPLPLEILVQHVSKKIRKPVELSFHEQEASFYINYKGKTLQLIQQNDREVRFYAESLHQAEEILFNTLRTFHPSFFIIDTAYSHYGWIAPIKKQAIL
ncbi:sporulation inhibitor of replication protein SirA [Pontibacillus salicampi]|uniref:Sporulation inhibitor of replication protein SirA n=1 Tax=Pontibacillus salicampi TaxID=1449801 RepID=A0ABV6LRH4_9BACI